MGSSQRKGKHQEARATFSEAIEAFQDLKGVQLVDKKHSDSEHRFYWVGKVQSGKILTVWFTRRAN